MHGNGCHYMSVIIEYVIHFTCEELVNLSSISHSGNRQQLRFSMSFLCYSINLRIIFSRKGYSQKKGKWYLKKDNPLGYVPK
jgi:hypothetical protein